MEESSANSCLHLQGDSPRPSSTSPGPPPSKRIAGNPGIAEDSTISTLPTINEDKGSSVPEIITGDLSSLSEVSSSNHPREYSNGSYMQQQQQQHEGMSMEHQNNQSHRPLLPQIAPQPQHPHPANSVTSSYYNFSTDLQQQQPPVAPTHTQHHMGWMQQQQHMNQSQLQSLASYHDHNYNAGNHMGLPQHMTSSTMSMTQGHNVTSTSPPETSGINFYNPQSPYYGIHPQHQQSQSIHQQSAIPSMGTNNGSGLSGYGQIGGNNHFAYPQLPVMQQMNQNYGGVSGQQHLSLPSHQQLQQQSHNKQIQNCGVPPHPMSLGDSANVAGGGAMGSNNNKSPWMLSTESPYPGGLEVLWREVPEECQRLVTLQDVPETARQRGYFTVCELIALKRSLVSRMSHERRSAVALPSGQDQIKQDAAALCEMSSVGMAVKEAMNALHEGDLPNPTDEQQSTTETNSNVADGSGVDIQNSNKLNYNTDSSSYAHQGHPGTAGSTSSKRHSDSSPLVGPPPPYRTATLVFKLLQIGNYQFRSFSEVNPNRLRVLFNTQRLTYECQLSIVRPPREGMPVLRKLLTVDIGFDQISVIRFGTDKLFLRVEGAPLLTVTYNPANDDLSCPPLSQQDLHLLEQIDKGQLKLSPCHQLYFLNERLVHLLEYQFRELPRFRHILQEGFNDQQQQQQHLQNMPLLQQTLP